MICRLCGQPFYLGDADYKLTKTIVEKQPGTGQIILRPVAHEDGSPTLYFHLHCLAEMSLVLIAAEGGRVDG